MPPSLSSFPRPSYNLVLSAVWTMTRIGTSSRWRGHRRVLSKAPGFTDSLTTVEVEVLNEFFDHVPPWRRTGMKPTLRSEVNRLLAFPRQPRSDAGHPHLSQGKNEGKFHFRSRDAQPAYKLRRVWFPAKLCSRPEVPKSRSSFRTLARRWLRPTSFLFIGRGACESGSQPPDGLPVPLPPEVIRFDSQQNGGCYGPPGASQRG